MTYRFRRITLAEALAEPEDEALFGPSYDERQRQLRAREKSEGGIDRGTYQPWKKPRIQRGGKA